MAPVSGDEDMVAGAKIALAFALDPQTCRAGKEQDPFVMFLTIWFVCRRGLTSRNDPLDSQTFSRKHVGENLGIRANRKVIEEIDHALDLGQAPWFAGSSPAMTKGGYTPCSRCAAATKNISCWIRLRRMDGPQRRL